MIAGSFDVMADKVIRIGHMGENCNIDDVALTLNALTEVLRQLNFPLTNNLKDIFLYNLNESHD